jgi:hypothetical protein
MSNRTGAWAYEMLKKWAAVTPGHVSLRQPMNRVYRERR